MEIKALDLELFFYPDVGDNLEQPEDERVKFIYSRRPTSGEMRGYLVNFGEGRAESEESMLKKYVKEIQNLKVGGKEIKTIKELIDCPPIMPIVKMMSVTVSDLRSMGDFDEGED